MSFTKTEIFSLSLSALLLGKQISNADTDTSNEARTMRLHWNIALNSTLADLDLDCLSEPQELELTASLADDSDYDGQYNYVYKYPDACVFFRRIRSGFEVDNKGTHISKRIGLYNGKKSIYTNQESAVGECIMNNISLTAVPDMAGMCIAYRLATLSAPILVGKGSKKLLDTIEGLYVISKGQAQHLDSMENFNYEADDVRSELVYTRSS